MSNDPLTTRLSRFTPDGGRLDRDALLFAAGRASARPSRRWLALTGVLAASQLLTLGLLVWPRPAQLIPAQSNPPAPIATAEPVPSPVPDVQELLKLRERVLATEGNLPPPAPMESLVPTRVPLRAFGAPPPELLH